jgi:type I restriction enzyme S subunit
VLISLVGTIGRTAVVPEHLAGANVARAIAVLPPSTLVSARWIELWFRSPQVRAQLESKAHEVARKTLNLEDVRAAAVALPPLAEQHRLATNVEDLDSIAADAISGVRRDVARCSRLRQSILKSAFEGKLVDQDPTDEPAEKLLERIRAERASSTAPKPKQPQKAKVAR